MTCSGCGKGLTEGEGVRLWETWFCSLCFISASAATHRELGPGDLAAFRKLARELAGFLPPELVEMIASGFYRRATGRPEPPPREELERFTGEIQRLAALSTFRKLANLLETWRGSFNEFVDGQYAEMREAVRKLTDFGAERDA